MRKSAPCFSMMYGRVFDSWQLADVEEEKKKKFEASREISNRVAAAKPAWLVTSLSLFFSLPQPSVDW